jgi:hypothetical protein
MSNEPNVRTEPACCSDRPSCCEDKAACCTTPPDSDGTAKTANPASACTCSVSCQR